MKKLTNEDGFTLVELMVVVAIIGILSAVAIPNFKQYQAKSKTSEAKLQLASIYSAETAFMSDWDNYATCLVEMGYSAAARGYYVIGFDAISDSNADVRANSNAGTCTDANFQLEPTLVVTVRGDKAAMADEITALMIVEDDGSAFLAGAAGLISADAPGGAFDTWTVDENKTLDNTIRGY